MRRHRKTDGLGALFLLVALIMLILMVSEARGDHNPHYEYPQEPVPECNARDLMVNSTTEVVMSCQDGLWTPMLTLEEAEDRTATAGGFTALVGLGVGMVFGYLYARSKP
jgi:hypothetical protein